MVAVGCIVEVKYIVAVACVVAVDEPALSSVEVITCVHEDEGAVEGLPLSSSLLLLLLLLLLVADRDNFLARKIPNRITITNHHTYVIQSLVGLAGFRLISLFMPIVSPGWRLLPLVAFR